MASAERRVIAGGDSAPATVALVATGDVDTVGLGVMPPLGIVASTVDPDGLAGGIGGKLWN